MPTYTAPGVYIQEVPSGVRTITSVSTSIAAFFGRSSKGKVNQAVRITSMADLERRFGAPHPDSGLIPSVRQFFANGGTDCYVIRLGLNAKESSVKLLDYAKNAVLVATARSEGQWGDSIRLEVDYATSNPDETFNLRVVHEEGGQVVASEDHKALSMDPGSPRFAPSYVTQSSSLIDLALDSSMGDPSSAGSKINTLAGGSEGSSQARRPLPNSSPADLAQALTDAFTATPKQTSFEISVNDGEFALVDLTKDALDNTSYTTLKDGIQGMINDALGALVPPGQVVCELKVEATLDRRFLGIKSDSGDKSSVRVRQAAKNDISGYLMLGVNQGGIEPVWRNAFRPVPTATMTRLGDVDAFAALNQNSFNQVILDGGTPVAVDLKTTAPTDRWYLEAGGGFGGVTEKLGLIAKAINGQADLDYRAEVWGYHLALRATSGTVNAKPTSISTVPAAAFGDMWKGPSSANVNVRRYSLGTTGNSPQSPYSSNGQAGSSGAAPDYATYLGSSDKQTGFHALDSVDLFNLMVLPGDSGVTNPELLWAPASTYCAAHRAFLIIDPPEAWTSSAGLPDVVQDTAAINKLRIGLEKDHAAVFYPRIQYIDNGLTKTIGPAGAIAGLMARTDAERGVWKAPAGIEATLRNVTGVAVKLTDAWNGILNERGVNCIRVFPNGIVSWGARTLDGDDSFGSEWKYIPIRRLALMLEESLFRGTRWVVFEPNDEPLWANIRLNVGAYMTSLFRQGAFQGLSPKEAFYVKCDKDTTTQDDRNKGIVNIEVGFAPLKPAEFVVIKIQQIAGEL